MHGGRSGIVDFAAAVLQVGASGGVNEVASKPGLGVILAIFAGLALLAAGWAWMVRPINLALGLGATVVMWALSFLALLQPGLIGGELIFGAVVLCVVAAGALAGRYRASGARGLSVGLVSATFNLMVIGAFLGESSQSSAATRGMYVLGVFAASGVLGVVGEQIGRRMFATSASSASSATSPAPSREPNAAAMLCAITTAAIFFMVVIGGLVTSMEQGLAVPDWPNSFGHNMLLFPISEMKGGVFYEHSHRLFGMLVGAAMLATWVAVFRTQKRALPRALVSLVLVLVVVQGVLGGLRVTGGFTASAAAADLAPSTREGIIHGMLGQVIFALAAVTTLAATSRWASTPKLALPGARALRLLPVVALALLMVQLFLGVAMRHLQVPPTAETGAKIPAWAMHGHITMAIIVAIVAVIAGLRCSHVNELPMLKRTGKAVMHTVGLQVVLGVAALVVVLVRR
ncbi:MAG: COX15/CtaA family protein, partial [Phycisphaerae bacterium]|nr:COX15/CtaA family protein [Phycisphaerae bacterium]